MVNAVDLAWAAGFIEGEGSFVRHRVRGGTICVSAPQVDPEPVLGLQRIFGGSVTKYDRAGRHVIHTWRVNGYNAAGVMMTLYGLMSERRKTKIRECLEQWRGTGVPWKFRQACAKGHTYISTRKHGAKIIRRCRICDAEGQKRRYVYRRGPFKRTVINSEAQACLI